MTPTSSISPKPKTPVLLNLSHYQNVHPFVKTLLKETGETFPLAGKLKHFLKNWEKVTIDSTILSIVKGYSIDFAETPYQQRTPIRAKLNQVQEELVSQEVKEMLEKGALREVFRTIFYFCSKLTREFSCEMSGKFVQCWRGICSNRVLSKSQPIQNKNPRKMMLFRRHFIFSCAMLSGVSWATLFFVCSILSQEYYDIIEQDFFM